MSYLATATNSSIDTSEIRTLLVQGGASYPVIRFVLDPSLTGLSWRVRGSYIGTSCYVTSEEITPTETVAAVTLDWSVSADFTTSFGDMQLSLVGSGELGEPVVKFIGDITIRRDYSMSSQALVTINLFEQLMAQANTTISKYPYVDETTGNWFVWNPTTELWVDTGVHAQGIQGEKGDKGDTGDGVIAGGTENQVLAKNSATDRDMKWIDISAERTATLASGSWVGSSAPYTQAVTIAGVTTAGKPPIIDVVLSDTYATAILEVAAYGLIYRFNVTGDNTVTAYATSVPSQAINIHAKVVI